MDELLKQELRAMSRNTIAPTILHAGSQINVIPSEATVIPTLLVGGTDAQRVAGLGIKVYGFAPEMFISGLHDWDRVHGHDERINIRSLQWGIRVLYDVVTRFTSDSLPKRGDVYKCNRKHSLDLGIFGLSF